MSFKDLLFAIGAIGLASCVNVTPCSAQAVQRGGVDQIWGARPSDKYILTQPSGDWVQADRPPPQAYAADASANSSGSPDVVVAETVETALTPYANTAAPLIKSLTAVSARDEYVRVFFAVQAHGTPLELRVSDVKWTSGAPRAGMPHRRAVHFGPVALNRTTTGDKRYRLAPLWLESTDEQHIDAGRQSVWMLQWWIASDHPAGRWDGTLTLQYRLESGSGWHSRSLPVSLEVLPVALERLPPSAARYGVWYGPTWRFTETASFQRHFADMREGGINQLGLMNVSADDFRYESGHFTFDPGHVEDVARRFRQAVDHGSLFVDLRMVTGYASLFGRAASQLTASGKALPSYLQLAAQGPEDVYALPPVENQWTALAYTSFASEMKRVMDGLPGDGDVYYFPQEEPSTRRVRQQIMRYFAPLTAKAGLPLVLVTSAGLTGGDDTIGIDSSISLICTDSFDQASIDHWRSETRPIEFYNVGENLRLSAGFLLHFFPVPVRGLTIWAYQFGNPISDADTKRGGVYAPVHFLTYPGDTGPVPTLRWIEFSEGITDRRFAYTAELQLERLRHNGANVTQLSEELSGLRATLSQLMPHDLSGYKTVAPTIGSGELDRYRQRYIDLLRRELAAASAAHRPSTKTS